MIEFSNLTAGGATNAGTSQATASVTPLANSLILFGFEIRNGNSIQPNVSSVAGCSLTWEYVDRIDYDYTSSSRKSLFLYRAMGSAPTTGTITITTVETESHFSWTVDQATDTSMSGGNGAGAVIQFNQNSAPVGASPASLSVALNAFANTANATYGVFADDGSGMTKGANFTLLGSGTSAGGNTLSEYALTNQTSVNITDAVTTSELGGIAIEVGQAFTVNDMLMMFR